MVRYGADMSNFDRVGKDHSCLVVIVAPEEGLGTASGRAFDELGVIGGLDLLGGAAEHGEHREADGADGERGRPLWMRRCVQS
jgi:hypothetical protein